MFLAWIKSGLTSKIFVEMACSIGIASTFKSSDPSSTQITGKNQQIDGTSFAIVAIKMCNLSFSLISFAATAHEKMNESAIY